MAFAEDPIDEEEADVEGEVEEGDVVVTEGEEEDDEELQSRASPDADTMLLFTKPSSQGASQLGKFSYCLNVKSKLKYKFLELVAGSPVEFLVGFRNKGEKDFVVDAIDASFRYPMDFNFFIQVGLKILFFT